MSYLRSLLVPKSSFEDFSNPSNFLWHGGLGRKTVAGENVSPAIALTLSTWFACIRNISEDVAKLPFTLYEKQSSGGKKRLLDHPVAALLDTAPNPEMTPMTFRETITGWALGWGNGYAEIERDGAGQPVALWPIHPWRVRVRRIDGQLIYDVWTSDFMSGKNVTLAARDVLHIRGFGDDPLCGLSVARLAAESIGLSLAAQTYGSAFFGNGATLGLTLEHPGKLSEQAQVNIRESWAAAHSGPDKAHKIAVLAEGMKANKISVPPEEAQFIATRTFQDHEIARWFRMPVHKIQQMDRATFTNIEQQSIEYATDCLTPWFSRWEGEGKRKLFDPRDASRYLLEHDVTALMRGDSAARSNYVRTMVSTAVLSPNEGRIIEGLNPDPSPAANKLYMQGAMSTLDRIVEGPPAPAVRPPGSPGANADAKDDQQPEQGGADKPAAALRPVFDDAEARGRMKERLSIARALKDHRAHTTDAFQRWAAKFYPDHANYLIDMMSAPVASLIAAIRQVRPSFQADLPALDQCVRDYCSHALRSVVATGAAFTPDQPLAQSIIAILTLEVAHV